VRQSRSSNDRQKTNIVEVLEFEQEVHPPVGNLFYSHNNDGGSSDAAQHQPPHGSHHHAQSLHGNQALF